MTGMQAALGVAQTARIHKIIENKRRVAHNYNRLLSDCTDLQLPVELDGAFNVYWMYGILLKNPKIDRNQFMDRLLKKGIDTRTFFCPMDQQPFLKPLLMGKGITCSNGDKLWKRGLYIPSSHTLEEETIIEVAKAIKNTIKELS